MNSVAFLIDLGLRATVVFSLAFIAMLALRGSSASVRYVVWSSVFAAVLVLPLLSIAGPRWEVQLAAPTAAARPENPAIEHILVTPAKHRSREFFWPMIVWGAGALALLVRAAAGHWRLLARFGAAEKIRDSQWKAILAEATARMGMRRPVDLRQRRRRRAV